MHAAAVSTLAVRLISCKLNVIKYSTCVYIPQHINSVDGSTRLTRKVYSWFEVPTDAVRCCNILNMARVFLKVDEQKNHQDLFLVTLAALNSDSYLFESNKSLIHFTAIRAYIVSKTKSTLLSKCGATPQGSSETVCRWSRTIREVGQLVETRRPADARETNSNKGR